MLDDLATKGHCISKNKVIIAKYNYITKYMQQNKNEEAVLLAVNETGDKQAAQIKVLFLNFKCRDGWLLTQKQ